MIGRSTRRPTRNSAVVATDDGSTRGRRPIDTICTGQRRVVIAA
jgi:hypothetical protein